MNEKKINTRVDQRGKYKLTVFRADGKIEDAGTWDNLFVNEGMDWLAAYQSTTPGSIMNHMLVGTVSTAATLTDVETTMGEVARNTMATRVAANNILTEVCTFAGNADSVTSVSIVEVGVSNFPTSGSDANSALRSRSTFSAVVLADSDFLRVQYETTVGSR